MGTRDRNGGSEGSKSSSRGGPALRGVVEALAVYAALPTVLMYPFGLLVLCAQVRLSYLDSLTAAWYAANLVPRPVTMGIGVGALWNSLTPFALINATIFVTGTVTMMLMAVSRRDDSPGADVRDAEESFKRARYKIRIPVVDLVLLPSTRLSELLLLAAPMAWPAFAVVSFFYLASVGEWGAAVSQIVLVSGFLTGFLILIKDALAAQYGRGSAARVLLRGTAVVFSTLLLTALLTSAPREPSLPRVELRGEIFAEGELLVHESGYWYFFEADGEREMRAVPDRRAGEVIVEGASVDTPADTT